MAGFVAWPFMTTEVIVGEEWFECGERTGQRNRRGGRGMQSIIIVGRKGGKRNRGWREAVAASVLIVRMVGGGKKRGCCLYTKSIYFFWREKKSGWCDM